MSKAVAFTIYGEPASKANSRRAVMLPKKGGGKRAGFIKSEKALDYADAAEKQIPSYAMVMFDAPVRVVMKIYYSTQRPDLDESLILDLLQAKIFIDKPTKKRFIEKKGVYLNDRLVREKHIYHGIDKQNPRAEILVEPI